MARHVVLCSSLPVRYMMEPTATPSAVRRSAMLSCSTMGVSPGIFVSCARRSEAVRDTLAASQEALVSARVLESALVVSRQGRSLSLMARLREPLR